MQRFIQLKNWIAKVALRFDLFKNQIALVALRFIAFKKFCAFLRCVSVYSEKMPTSGCRVGYDYWARGYGPWAVRALKKSARAISAAKMSTDLDRIFLGRTLIISPDLDRFWI